MDYRCAVFLIRLDGRLFGGVERLREIVALYHYFADRDLPTSCGVAAGFLPDEPDVDDDFHLLSYYLDLDGCDELYCYSSVAEKTVKAENVLDFK